MDGLQDLTKTQPIIEVRAQGAPGRRVGQLGDFLSLLLQRFAAKENTPPAVDVLMSVFTRKTTPPRARDDLPEPPEPSERPALPRHRTRDEVPEVPPEPEYARDNAGCCEPPVEKPPLSASEDQPVQEQPGAPKAHAPPVGTPPRPEQPAENSAQPAENSAQPAEGAAAKSDGQQLPPPVGLDEPAQPVDASDTPADDVAKLLAVEQALAGKPGQPPVPDMENAPPEEPEPIQQPKPPAPGADGAPREADQREPLDVPDEDVAQEEPPPDRELQAAAERTPHGPARLHGGEDRIAVTESPGVSAHNAPLIDAEAADRVASLTNGPPTVASFGATASADAVASIASLMGADVSSSDGQQIGPRTQSATTSAQDAAAAQAETAERLNTVFKQVLSTSRLPLDMQKRIELARSIGQQVIRSALVNVRDGRTHVTLQLKPPSLGTVRMQLIGEGKMVTARLTVESPLVRQAVEQHLQQLRSMLREEGFQLQRFEVAVRSEGGSNPWASDHAEEGHTHRHRVRAGMGDEAHTENEPEPIGDSMAAAAAVHDGAVDYLA